MFFFSCYHKNRPFFLLKPGEIFRSLQVKEKKRRKAEKKKKKDKKTKRRGQKKHSLKKKRF
jgi:hypothetical protein